MCSSSACAPPPTAPRPSSVGNADAGGEVAVRGAAHGGLGQLTRAVPLASARRPVEQRRTGGDLHRWPVRPAAARSAPRRAGSAAPTAASPVDPVLLRLACWPGRRSQERGRRHGVGGACPHRPPSGSRLCPAPGTPIAATARIRWASSTPALMPFSGSAPACAARPVISIRYPDVPFRPVFSGHRPAGALQHETGRAAAGLVLDQGPRGRRADLLVTGDQQAAPRPGRTPAPPATGQRVDRLHQTGLHVHRAGPADHAAVRSTTGGRPASRSARRCRDGPGSPPGSGPGPNRQRRWLQPSISIRSGATPSRAGADLGDQVGAAAAPRRGPRTAIHS